MAGGYLEAHLEASPGYEGSTPTLSTKQVYIPCITAQPTLANSPLNREDELRGNSDTAPLIPETYDPTAAIDVRMYPDTLGFILCNTLGRAANYAVATGNGIITDVDSVAIPTGAYRHRWTAPYGPDGIVPQTGQYRFAYADQSTFFVSSGQSIDTIAFDTPVKGGATIKPNGAALYQNRIADPVLTPAYETLSITPFLRSGLTLSTWLANTGSHENFTLSVNAPTVATHSMGHASRYPDLMEKGDQVVNITGSLPQRALAAADWDAMRDNTGFAAVAKWVNDSKIVSTYPYKFSVSMSNCQYEGGEANALANTRHIGANFTFRATNAGSPSAVIELVNATASYA